MKQFDDEKKQKPPSDETPDGRLLHFRKPKKNAPMDVEWFYEDEEFFADCMDEFDW